MRSPLFLFIFFNFYSWGSIEDSKILQWEKLFHFYNGKTLIHQKKFLKTLEDGSQFNFNQEINYWENVFNSTAKNDEAKNLKCIFPARYLLVKGDDQSLEVDCPSLANFMKDFDIQKVFLVFSSYYPQNSASLFGHTFLRFQRKDSKGQELLDWGISYSAVTNHIDPFSMLYKSFFSTFEGNLQHLPYYYKVREYNDFEFRPLWSYEINLSVQQIKLLLYHLWELSKVPLDYQYLTHNCSSLILDAISAVVDGPSLREEIAFYHIPIDTVKALDKRGLLKSNPAYRPSLMQEWNLRYQSLNYNEKKSIDRFIKVHDVNELDTLNLLDAAIDYFDFKYGKKLLAPQGENIALKTLKNALLLKRSQMENNSKPLIHTPELPPDKVHDIRKFSMGLTANSNSQEKILIRYRFAYHDFTDPMEGISPRMKINFMQPELSVNFQEKKISLENLELLDLASWSESPEKAMALSYELYLGWNRWMEQDKNQKGIKGQTSFGYTFDLCQSCFISALLTEQLTYAHLRQDKFSFKFGPTIQFQWNETMFGILLRYGHYFELTGYQKDNEKIDYALVQTRYALTKSTNVAIQFQHEEELNSVATYLQYYY